MKKFVCFVVFTALLTVSSTNSISDPPGCDVPSNLAKVNLSEVAGISYIQAYVNFDSQPTGVCYKLDIFVGETGKKGTAILTSRTNTTECNVDVFSSKFIREGVAMFTSLRDPTFSLWDYYVTPFGNDSLIAHHCYIRNGTTVGQDFAYVSRRQREVPQQQVLDGFRAAGVIIRNSYFVPQTNCRN